MAVDLANDLIPTDLDDVSSVATIENLSDADLAVLLPLALREFSTRSTSKPAVLVEQGRFITEFVRVVQRRATEAAVVAAISTILTVPLTSQEAADITSAALLQLIYSFSEDDMHSYHQALTTLAQAGAEARENTGFRRILAQQATDAIRFMEHREAAWAPQHQNDCIAARTLQERVRTAREMRPYVDGLLGWLQDDSLPSYKACVAQLARFPQLTIVPIGKILKNHRGHGAWINNVLQLVQSHVPVGRSWESIFPQVNGILAEPVGDEVKYSTFEHAKSWIDDLNKWRSSQEGLRCA